MVEKANLIKGKKFWEVELKTRKGSQKFPIFDNAKYFREEDAQEGDLVTVIREKGQIRKVVLEGKPEYPPKPAREKTSAKKRNTRRHRKISQQPGNTNEMQQASPEILAESFYNPYTFIPFSERPVTEKKRHTPLSADDDINAGYMTGLIRLKVETESPLMSRDQGTEHENGHMSYRILRIGDNPVIPSTSIKGFLRNLATILSGGPLNTVDENAYLCQGRDVQIQGMNGKAPFLARVKEPGDAFHDGTLELGESRWISTLVLARYMNRQQTTAHIRKKRETLLDKLENEIGNYENLKAERKFARDQNDCNTVKKLNSRIDSLRNKYSRSEHVKTVEDLIKSLRAQSSPVWILPGGRHIKEMIQGDKCPGENYWQLKLSGPPVQKFNKKEGLFKPNGNKITIPSELWTVFASRNMHGARKKLDKNDLVWLEVKEDCTKITDSSQILSLQWARWGKKGVPMLDKIKHGYLKPEWMTRDAHVHPVTSMFGLGTQSPKHKGGPLVAAKLRFGNLVFNRDVEILPCQPIAVLASPHPGCLAFYRDNTDPKSIASENFLKGYKVYRTTRETGPAGPWNYNVQPVFGHDGMDPAPGESRENVFSSQLLAPGAKGELEIAYRSITCEELSLLMAACSVPWRLGGGKPLGLGLCRITGCEVFDELGKEVESDAFGSGRFVDENLMACWIASQKPVEKLRYPRAVTTQKDKSYGKGKTSCGGHHWFSRMAKPKQDKNERPGTFKGLMPIYSTGDLKGKADENIKRSEGCNEHENDVATPISGTVLPQFNPEDPLADKLYGYDIHFNNNKQIQKKFNTKNQTCYDDLKKFSG